FHARSSVKLGLISPTEEGSYKPFDAVQCAIEPAGHAAIYQKLQEILEKPYAKPLAEALSYVIIKGSYAEFALILNVREATPEVVKATNTLSKSLTHFFKEIVGLFLYEDQSDGRYYLGSSAGRRAAFRKVFGKAEVYQRICGRSFLYSPLSFSQVNLSIVESFVTTAGDLLNLSGQTRFIDLYCGYGLFALCLSNRVRSTIGIENSADSIQAAIDNALRQRVSNVRFIRGAVTPETLQHAMKSSWGYDAVLLDPPRNGTAEGVIESIATWKPQRVLHIFCNIDIMPAELKRWSKCGYTIAKAVPFDMFPGTPTIEMMVLLNQQL
ncbi:MAG: methyltransferase domain-containing protein, partial [Bacteroidota bacterium]